MEIENFSLILQPRYSEKIDSEEEIEEMNHAALQLVCGGKDSGRFGMLKIDFKVIEPVTQEETAEIDIETQMIPDYDTEPEAADVMIARTDQKQEVNRVNQRCVSQQTQPFIII